MNKPISTPATTVCHASPSDSEGPAMWVSFSSKSGKAVRPGALRNIRSGLR